MKQETEYDSIREKSLKSVKWAYGSTLFPLIIPPIVTVVLAALLGPRIYGIVAIAALIVSLADVVKDSALLRAFIQSEDDEQRLFNHVFWLSLGYGVAFYLAILIAAPLIADLFHSPESVTIIRALGFQVVLSSLCTGHNGIVIRSIDFKKKFKIDLLPNIALLCIAIPLAYGGMGVWAMVIGYLACSVVRTIVVWWFVPVRPQWDLDRVEMKRIAVFGFFCSIEALLGWCLVWGDRAIVGHFLDVRLLGIYTLASTIAVLAFTIVLAPVTYMSYPVFCRLKDDMAQLRDTIYTLLRVVGLFTFPIGVLICFSTGIVVTLIGEKWTGIEIPLGALAVAESLFWTVNSIGSDAVRAMGKADIMPKFHLARLVYTVPVLVWGVRWGGLDGFCYAKLITSAASFVFFIILLKVMVGIGLKEVARRFRLPMLGALTIGGVGYFLSLVLKSWEMGAFGSACILVGSAILIYVGLLRIFDPALMKGVWRDIIRAL